MKKLPVTCKIQEESGQVLAEACIGLALMAFVWVLFSFVAYMANNQIRTAMAARHAAWMLGNGLDPNTSIPQQFFLGDDASLAHVDSSSFYLSAVSVLTGDNGPNLGNWGNDACLATVTFGMSAEDLKTTSRYPFSFLETHVPFMPSTMLENYATVQSHCAWPANVGDTWQSASEAFKGILAMIYNNAKGAVGGLIDLVDKVLGGLFS